MRNFAMAQPSSIMNVLQRRNGETDGLDKQRRVTCNKWIYILTRLWLELAETAGSAFRKHQY